MLLNFLVLLVSIKHLNFIPLFESFWENVNCCGLPESVCGEEGDVKGLFLGVVFERDQHSVAEPHICQQLQAHQTIAGWTVVRIQNLTWVEELRGKGEKGG